MFKKGPLLSCYMVLVQKCVKINFLEIKKCFQCRFYRTEVHVEQAGVVVVKITPNTNGLMAAPVTEWVRSLKFSALNHSIISPL